MGSPDLELRDDGTLVVEAPTVEAALEAVQHHCGPEATIVEAEKVQSKGIAGFFSKQLYRVHVAPNGGGARIDHVPEAHSQAAASPMSDVATGRADDAVSAGSGGPTGAAVDFVLRQIEAGEYSPHRTFGETLHAELAARGETVSGQIPHLAEAQPSFDAPYESDSPQAVSYEEIARQREALFEPTIDLRDEVVGVGESTTPVALDPGSVAMPPAVISSETLEPAAPTDAARAAGAPLTDEDRVPLGRPVDEWVPGAGPVRWSVDHLSRIGLPYRLIVGLGDLDPKDDLAWVYRLAEASSRLCGRIPDEALLMVGCDLSVAATRMGVDAATYPDPPAYQGDAAVSLESFGAGFHYVERVRAGRPLHVVCDADGFGTELLDPAVCPTDVAVVSISRSALAVGLQAAVAADAVLGYFIDGDDLVRVTPFELALAIRGQMPRE